jgi:hypothetical protein
MAAVVISKSNALNDDLWNEWAPQLIAVMQDASTEKNKDEEVLKAIFNVKSSNRFGEKATTMTEFADMEVVAEGADGVQDDFSEGYAKLFEHYQFIKTLVLTAEMAEDSQVDMMKAKAANFIRAYKRSQLDYATAMLIGATAATFTYGTKTGIDCAGGDGVSIFNTKHPAFKYKTDTTKVQSNVFTNALGTDAVMLNRLANIGRNFHNDSWVPQGYTFDTIIIPGNQYQLEDTVKKIIGSDGEVGTDHNDINTQRGKWKLVVNHAWQSDTATGILMSSQANKELLGNVFWDRTAFNVKDEVLVPSRNYRASGRARWSAGCYNWRHVIMFGAAAGTTLA